VAPSPLERLRSLKNEYPRQVWILVLGTLINNTGSGLVFPFLSLYLTRQLQFSMTEVGVIYSLFAVMSVISQVAGGHLADQRGRKPVMIASLLGMAVGTLLLGTSSLIDPRDPLVRWGWVVAVVSVMGLTMSAYGPAANAMVADLLEPGKRIQAYSLLRVMVNLGVAIGPAIGGILANISYLYLFAGSALASLVYMVILVFMTHETLPAAPAPLTSAAGQAAAVSGFGQILRDNVFIGFVLLIVTSQVVYAQMNTTLPVFLNQQYGVSEQWYGLLMSLNAGMVVVFQLFITRRIASYDRSLMLALGNVFFAVGFGMFGFVGTLPLFFLAQAVWTVGEMICSPAAQTYVADIAPGALRGRYMGLFGVGYAVGYGLGPLLGGAVMDSLGGAYIWYGAFVVDAVVVVAYLLLRGVFARRAALAA
jgi:MFS family permease